MGRHEWNNFWYGADNYGTDDEKGKQPNYNTKVRLNKKEAYERGVECIVIDIKQLSDNWDHDFEITVANEPWWYSAFW